MSFLLQRPWLTRFRTWACIGDIPSPVLSLYKGVLPLRQDMENGLLRRCWDLKQPPLSKHNFPRIRKAKSTPRNALGMISHAL